MVVEQSNIDHIMRGLQSTEGVRLHNHRKKLRQRFDIIKKLGQGTYGKVQLGINKETGQEVAIKTIKKCKIETEADLVRIRREIQIMSSVRHPNIIHIYEVFENREKMVLVMEYAAGGELYDFLSERKVLEEAEARRIFRQISTAVYYCHKHKICHRDLKLENILLDEHGSAKIADFGLSNVFDEQRLLSTFCGSPLYASPEIVKGTPYHGPEVDCWSLGVLLYTLVYGAMPFDGSNFKRLVKQISQGDYFEPKKASPASPLIREMLTVNPGKRATIEQICSHWWVNQGFNVSCLDIAEDLANQTPVRLDLLLSLAPPPENSDKLVVTEEQGAASVEPPPRSMSFGSFMELDPNTEQRIRDFVAQEVPSDSNANEKTTKRKLETGQSETSVTKGGARKKERTKPETREKPKITETAEQSANVDESNNVIMDFDESNKAKDKTDDNVLTDNSANVETNKLPEETEKVPTEPKETEKVEAVKSPETEKTPDVIAKDKPTRKSVKSVKKKVPKDSEVDKKDESESADTKVKVKKKKKSESPAPVEDEAKKEGSKEREEVGKEIKREGSTRKSRGNLKLNLSQEKEKSQTPGTPEDVPSKPMERRKSKIFETAEKFMTGEPRSPTQEKPKKVFIPGVKVSDFAKAFERRSSVTAPERRSSVAAPERRQSVTTPALKSSPSKKTVAEKKSPEEKAVDSKKEEEISSQTNEKQTEDSPETKVAAVADKSLEVTEEEKKPTEIGDEKLKKLKDSARNIIANALIEEERKKVKKQILKPPVPRTKSEDIESKKKALTLQIGKETATVQVHTPENTKFLFEAPAEEAVGDNKENIETPKEKKTAKVEITLKSNTLPRRTSKAEIQLASPQQKQAESGSFRTEVERRVGDPSAVLSTQRSEVAFPVSAAQQKPIRSMSLEPEGRKTQQAKERIVPIQVEEAAGKEDAEARDRVRELERPASQTEARGRLPYQRTLSQRSSSLSRQSTQDSDTESTISASGEPIRKSPREFIIPIAVEGGGYVTPRATSLEPSESTKRAHRPFSRKISLWSDNGSEDESPFSTLQRHPSRDLDEPFRMHRLRSSRPTKPSADRAESLSGSEEEEEEDDDGFEILTAENLFSTLLSRVRSLTQRLNVDDGVRPGFPSSRLMSYNFGPSERLFSNLHQPLTRLSDRSEFGRSLSRDMENGVGRWSRGADLSESDSTRSVPRGHSKSRRSESDTDSISESSAVSSHRKPRKSSEKKTKRSHSHSRTGSVPVSLAENEELTEYVPSSDGYRSMYAPSHRAPGEPSPVSRLHRTSSLKSDGPKRRPERKSIGIFEECLENEAPLERDFYDILAEKYGIRNVKRYDLGPTERQRSPTQSEEIPSVKHRPDVVRPKLAENRRSLISLVEAEQKDKPKPKLSNSEQSLNDIENTEKPVARKVLPPLPPKPQNSEKYKTPSERLAAVLNKLESNHEKNEKKPEVRGIPNDLLYGRKETKKKKAEDIKRVDNERLADLSPQALELYEKTLGLYQKTLEKKSDEDARKFIEQSEKLLKEPKKAMTRHKSDMSLKDYEKLDNLPTKEMLMNPSPKLVPRETPEKSVLSKYFHYSSLEGGLSPKTNDRPLKDPKLKHYGSLQAKLDDKKDDVEITFTVKLPDKDKSPEKKRKSTKIEKEKSPDKKLQEKKKATSKENLDEEAKKRAVRIKRLSKDLETELENELNKMESEEVWKKQEVVENPTPAAAPAPLPLPLPVPFSASTKTPAPATVLTATPVPRSAPPTPTPASKNKFLSSLEKKFEKFRSSDKKYVDKAIRSLRESSLGPKDVASENVLIKRAVSMSDCSKPIAPSRIQSTVNSVLGMFKKIEGPETKKDEMPLIKKLEITKPVTAPRIESSETERQEAASWSRRPSCNSGNNSVCNNSSSALLGLDDSSSFLSPDSESFDSWSNCSDFGTPDELIPNLKSISPVLKLANMDDVGCESVGDRIRRKSFYTRFNERKKPRKSAILEGRKKYDQEMNDEVKNQRETHSYNRTMTQSVPAPRPQQPYLRSLSSVDYSKPKPFYRVGSKSPVNDTQAYRKSSLDWSKNMTNPTFVRSVSQSSSNSSYLGGLDNVRNRRTEYLERPFSPVRTLSPTRKLSPNFGFRRSPSTNALD